MEHLFRGFKSRRSPQFHRGIAQLAEHWILAPAVFGSIPNPPAILMSKYKRVNPLERSNNHRQAILRWWDKKTPEERSEVMKRVRAGNLQPVGSVVYGTRL